MNREKIIRLIKSEVPQKVFLELYKTIPRLWNDAYDSTKASLPEPTAKNLFPHQRRALIEMFIHDLGIANSCFININDLYNKNGSHHSFQLETENLVIVQALASGWSDKPRDANYRGDDIQLELFMEELEYLPMSTKLHMILTHGSRIPYSNNPDFIKFVIPSLYDINLLELIEDITFIEEEDIASTPAFKMPQIKTNTIGN